MSSKKKKAWKSDSEHGAFLFLLYHFRVYDPNGYSTVEIYDHPDFPFKDNYSKKISTHIVKRFPTGVTTTSEEETPSAESSESSWTPRRSEVDLCLNDCSVPATSLNITTVKKQTTDHTLTKVKTI